MGEQRRVIRVIVLSVLAIWTACCAGCDALTGGTLHDAVKDGDLKALKALLRQGADPNRTDDQGWTPLHRASGYDDLAMVDALIRAGADPSIDCGGLTPLHLAAHEGSRQVAERLIAGGAPVNANTSEKAGSPLHVAARAGNREVVKSMLAHGADLEAETTIERRTPLLLAVGCGHVDTAECLLNHGANPNPKPPGAPAPLTVAVKVDNAALIDLLDGGRWEAPVGPDGAIAFHIDPAPGFRFLRYDPQPPST